MVLSIEDLKSGEKGRVAGYIKGATVYREKLLAMGLVRGTEFTVERVAPLGDPVQIQVRGFGLSLRKDEARAVKVEREE